MKNFKSSVPLLVQAKLHSLATEIEMSWHDMVNAFASRRPEAYSDVRLDEIEGNYVSGWMPNQDGGFSVNQIFDSGIDTAHFTNKQTEYITDQYENCFHSFQRDNGIEPATDTELTEEQQEAYCEYEMDWFRDGALFSVQMFMDGYNGKLFSFDREPEQTVTIRVSINYKSEYFAERGAEDIKQIIMTESEFMAMNNADIIKQIINQG